MIKYENIVGREVASETLSLLNGLVSSFMFHEEASLTPEEEDQVQEMSKAIYRQRKRLSYDESEINRISEVVGPIINGICEGTIDKREFCLSQERLVEIESLTKSPAYVKER